MARPRTVLLGIAVAIAVAAGGLAATAQPLAGEAQTQAQAEELSATLVQTANLIQSQEQDAIDTEARLDELRLRRRGLAANFDRRSGELSGLLGALQRVGRQPSALVLARPESAIEQVRGAMLLGAVIKMVDQEAAKLRLDLKAVDELQANIELESGRIEQLLAELHSQKNNLSELLQARSVQQAEIEGDSAQATQAAASLAAQARDTHELLAKLQQHRSTTAPPPKPSKAQTRQQVTMALPLALQLPVNKRRFDKARGRLPLPARGKIVAHFGRPNGAGGARRGINIRTRDSAEVVAPFDGKVVFAGPFRDYGQLIILETGGGYHILLSGMSLVNGVVGQSVSAGEPVGRMGGHAGTAAGGDGSGKDTDLRDLYVEFRKDGEPFNPLPWLALSEKKVSG